MSVKGLVLIIHPELATLKNVARLLEQDGYEALIAENIQQALDQIACQKFVLILVEIVLAPQLGLLPQGTKLCDLYQWMSQKTVQ